MRIESVELRRLRLPLVAPFRTSLGTERHRDVLLVHVLTSASEGWGECVAFASPIFSSEYTDGAHDVTRSHLLPRLFAHGNVEADDVAAILRPVRGHPMAKAAVEMAVLDAELRACGTPLGEFLGATRAEVDCGVSVGIYDDVADLLHTVERHLEEGYRRIKLKIEPGTDVEPVRAVRERFGDIPLQVDANAAYSRHDGHRLAALDEFDLLLIEQPLPEEDLLGHAELAKTVRTPICLDESITSARVAADAIALGACSIVNVKAGRVGGYLEARRVHNACAEHGVPVWCGGMLESGIGRSHNIALSTLDNFALPGDVSASKRYWKEDVIDPEVEVSREGFIKVSDEAGTGYRVREDLVEKLTVKKEVVRG